MKHPMTGRIEAVLLAQDRGTPMLRVAEASAVTQRGLEGDRHAKRKLGHARQVLLLDSRSLETLRLAIGQLKENVVVSGVALEALPAGQRLRLGERVIVELTGPCVPCHKLNALRPGLLKESWGQRGQLARILEGGSLREGDEVVLLDVNPDAPKPIRPKLP